MAEHCKVKYEHITIQYNMYSIVTRWHCTNTNMYKYKSYYGLLHKHNNKKYIHKKKRKYVLTNQNDKKGMWQQHL